MIIIGERINSTRKSIRPAVENRDGAVIEEEARKQAEAGAHYIDVNAGALTAGEPEALAWLVKTVQAVVDLPLALDSANPEAIAAGLKVHRGRPIINSINGEQQRIDALLPLIRESGARVIALCMDERGVPRTAEQRIEVGTKLVELLGEAGVAPEDIFVDPCVMTIAAPEEGQDPPGLALIKTVAALREKFPEVHIVAGVSNISHMLPKRPLLNRAACIALMAHGLDAAIIDPTDRALMSLIIAAEAVLGRDEYCVNYVAAEREGRLVV